jgi:secreted trypsin-like serine protease
MSRRIAIMIRLAALAVLLAGLGPVIGPRATAAPVETEIVGGQQVPQGSDPFMVLVQFRIGQQVAQCSGTLLNKTHVLTAAHCVTDGVTQYQDHQVLVGAVRVGQMTRIDVVRAWAHPRWNQNKLEFDVAVLKLAQPATGIDVGTIRIPASGDRRHEKTGQKSLVAGWGSTFSGGSAVTHLRRTQLEVYAFKTCRRAWAGAVALGPEHICAFAPSRDTCQGDSGGPLFVRTGKGAVQIGVTSFGYGCAERIPGVYTRLSNPPVNSFVRRMMAA